MAPGEGTPPGRRSLHSDILAGGRCHPRPGRQPRVVEISPISMETGPFPDPRARGTGNGLISLSAAPADVETSGFLDPWHPRTWKRPDFWIRGTRGRGNRPVFRAAAPADMEMGPFPEPRHPRSETAVHFHVRGSADARQRPAAPSARPGEEDAGSRTPPAPRRHLPAYSQPFWRAMRAASTRLAAPSLLIASER